MTVESSKEDEDTIEKPGSNERAMKSNRERSRRARVRKKRYIEDIEAQKQKLEDENLRLKERVDELEQAQRFQEAGGEE